MRKLSPLERQCLVERHLISLLSKLHQRSGTYKQRQVVSIMVNEEDHIRIQTILRASDKEVVEIATI